MMSVDEALALILAHATPQPAEAVPLAEALGQVLAADVRAVEALPPFPASIVDGFALRVADGHAPRHLAGEQMAGAIAQVAVTPGTAVRITTGAPIPLGADAVVKVEHADEVDGQVVVHPQEQLRAGANIRTIGSDITAGVLVLAAGTILGPAEVGVLASLGYPRATVHRRPVVGVFSTGDELVEPGQPLGPGQIRDSNRTTLLAAVGEAGGQPLDLGIVRDRPGELEERLAHALAVADLLVTSGGVSMGELDLLKPLLERWGQVHFGRVAMKPGKPFTCASLPARAPDGEPDHGLPARLVFALPGNPVSALVTFQLFAVPAIRRHLGFSSPALPRLIVTLGHEFQLDPERPEYHRVTLRRQGDQFIARSTGSQASSRLLSVAGANALLILEQGEGTLPAGIRRPALLLDTHWLTATPQPSASGINQ
jgi:molybdenum cofactor synthesis domain-containing protein